MIGATLAMRGRVEIRGGALKVGRAPPVAIGDAPLLLGRDATCDIVIDDPRVSAVHAELVATALGVRLRDLGSRNGTWLDRARVVEAYLTEPHRVSFGETRTSFSPATPRRVGRPKLESFGAMVADSWAMRAVFEQLARVAPTELAVLVLGETGTGKERAARALHDHSARARGPFLVVDCGAIVPTLAESTLFGHERGAFTGATASRASPFEVARGGTLFLDELGELPLEVQTRLLRVLAEKKVQRVGSHVTTAVDVRVVAATRRDLTRAVNDGTFRSDLYFRLAQVRVELPPLRDRREDIPALITRVLEDLGAPDAFDRVSTETLERLLHHDWPGNVRELRNATEVALALSGGAALEIERHLAGAAFRAPVGAGGYHEAKRVALTHFEREYFAGLIAVAGTGINKLSELSGLARPHVRRYLRAHGLRAAPARRQKR
jgi:DNA-binding NtrC family response regulator